MKKGKWKNGTPENKRYDRTRRTLSGPKAPVPAFNLSQNEEQILFQRLEDRILAYLKKRRSMQQNNRLLLTHRQIALDLGSAREVITRTLGKMEADGLLRTFDDGGLELL